MRFLLVAAALSIPATAGAQLQIVEHQRLMPTRTDKPSKENKPSAAESAICKKAAKDWVNNRIDEKDKKTWHIIGWEFGGTINGPVSKGKTWTVYIMRISPMLKIANEYHREIYFNFEGENLAYPPENWPRDLPAPGQLNVAIMNMFDATLQRDHRTKLGTPRR